MWLPAVALVCAASGALAEGVSFTADAVQTHPQQGSEQGKLFVADRGMRMERSQQGRTMVQISLPGEGIMRVLDPAQRTYMEARTPTGGPGSGIKPDTPCMGLGADRCKMIGTEAIGSVKAEKWTLTPEQAPGAIVVWWDPERKLAVRQQFPDGGTMQMTMAGETTWEGRKVETWRMTSTSAKGEIQRAEQLFDRELNIAVREQFPNGLLRELRNIKLVKAEAAWFDVPEGFKEQAMPQAGAAGTAGQQPMTGGANHPPQGYQQPRGQAPQAVPQGYPPQGYPPQGYPPQGGYHQRPGYPPQYQGGQPAYGR
jgi:hypothetical protein